ncbi:MAG TPA: glycosyltransferase [Acetobacteraceae bacterium]|nr:glycosyltransferase [Acetobacteraceae bacterium]
MSTTVLPRSGLRHTAAATPLLVYRDRIGVPSEVQFLRRQYVGFTRLAPVWVGRHIMPLAPALGGSVLRLGGDGPAGWLQRALFRHFGHVPALPLAHVAPVLHAQFARGGALALPLAQALGLRLVVTLHGGDVSKAGNWRGTVQARRWPAVVATAARFVCVSAAVADTALAHGVPRDKLVVLPIGVEVPAAPPPSPVGPPYHLFAGRFVAKKGIAGLAAAVRRLRAAGDATSVICIGDGPERPALEALAREAGGVTLNGWLPPEAVAARMAQAWSLLVPSVVAADGDAEGLPSVIPEAMAQGCPIIGSAQGGIAEAVRHGQTGLLVPSGDAAALAEAMHRLVSEPQLRHDLGCAAFGFARAHLNASVQSAGLENLLLEVGT